MCMGCNARAFAAKTIANCSLDGAEEEFRMKYQRTKDLVGDEKGLGIFFDYKEGIDARWEWIVQTYLDFDKWKETTREGAFVDEVVYHLLNNEEKKSKFCKKHNVKIELVKDEEAIKHHYQGLLNYHKAILINNWKDN